MVYNRSNFFHRTFCLFTEVPEWPSGPPDYVSKSGSGYYFYEDKILRVSHHWGRAATCKWRLLPLPGRRRGMRAGVANWSDFKADVPGQALYWIGFDSRLKEYHYFHKDCVGYDGQPLRDEFQTMKALRKMRRACVKD